MSSRVADAKQTDCFHFDATKDRTVWTKFLIVLDFVVSSSAMRKKADREAGT